MRKDSRKKQIAEKVLFTSISLVIGGIAGYFVGAQMTKYFRADTLGETILSVGQLILEFVIAFYLQIIIHEGGHLIGGLMSGYRFVSFRIGSIMWKRENDGRLRLCRHSLAGTGGQCIMCPPDGPDEKIPVVLYNMGGSLLNILTVVPFALLHLFLPFLNMFFLVLSMTGVVSAMLNGIPLKTGELNNDGYNTLEICRDRQGRHAFLIQLRIAGLVFSGTRLKDMPEEYFQMPASENLGSGLVATLAVFRQNWLMDQCRLEEAESLTRLLLKEDGVLGLYKKLLTCDLVTCILLNGGFKDEAASLLGKQQIMFMKQMRFTNPSIVRTEYICAVLLRQDMEDAKKAREVFDKVCKNYPNPSELESERELMQLCDSVAFPAASCD